MEYGPFCFQNLVGKEGQNWSYVYLNLFLIYSVRLDVVVYVRDMSLQKQEFYKIGKRNDCPTKISLKSQCTQLRQRCFQNTYLVQF